MTRINNVIQLNVKRKKRNYKSVMPLVYYNTFPMFEVSLIISCANQDGNDQYLID